MSQKLVYKILEELGGKATHQAEIQTFITGNAEKKINVVMDVLEKAFGEKKVKKELRARK